MADASVVFLLEQVTEVIKGYADLISGADKEFKRLKEDVELLKAILKDTAHRSNEDEGARLTKNKIREVVYEVEDAIDSWLTESKSKSKAGRLVMNFSFAKQVKSLREDKVKDMLEKAKEMKTALAASVGTSKEQEAQDRRTVMGQTIRQERIVGLEDEEKEITKHLMKNQRTLDIISIIGMPGLGKTTLAWKIFSDEKIGFAYPIRIWVHFSESFNSRDVLVQIMKHFTSNNDHVYSMTSQDLSSAVRAYLSRDKFLLVLDDVWKTEHWDDIKNALPYSNGNGKVLITSREMRVGIHVRQITEPHKQRPLHLHESWELLQWEVFGEIGSCPEELKDIGELIAKRCEGVPLTIVVFGGVLKDHYYNLGSVGLVKDKWEELSSNVNRALKEKANLISDVVALSYERLPDHLRDCFLYLGVIPAGYEISTWTLTRMWIAEGFIQPDENQSLEKTAEEYLNDLISRNLLIVRKMNPMHEVKLCRVHDIIRMFCIDEASKQNLFQEVRMSDGVDDGALESKMQNMHRLCLHSDLDKFFDADLEGPRVRSFICFRKDAMDLEPDYNLVIPANFPLLRILHSKSIKFNQFPQTVTELIHLRYIVLCVADLKTIPEPISQLWNLQTIVVDTNSDLLTMEANIWKMIRLRHVKTKAAIVLDKKKVKGEAGKNLQTLNRLSPESVTSAIAAKATNLKTLGIRGKLSTMFDDMHLEKLSSLEKLKLYQAATENRLQRFPDSKRFPPNLKRLTLSNTFLDWKHMSTLAMIGDLQVLKLKNNAFKGISWKADNNDVFKKLQFLLIFFADLVIWEASTNAFPRLRHLELKNCEDLKEIPDCVLQKLENLDIDRVRKSITDSARKLGDTIKLSTGPACDLP